MLKRSKKSGFTLLELLIVVIIVSILAGVALPQFGRMTRRARIAEAQNMIGGIMTAQSLYYAEHSAFTATRANLLAEYPVDNTTPYNYVITGDTAAPVSVVATGRLGAAGITVTGTLTNAGVRTITAN